MPANMLYLRRPRCMLVYALAPDHVPPAETNRAFNEFIADPELPLAVFHDHFLGEPGGVAIFYAETAEEREALRKQQRLSAWHVDIRPMVFSDSPAALDEQIAFTLRAYRSADWEQLQRQHRPRYGSASREAGTAEEGDSEN